MTRTEHREASHLEDDGGIREIIQSAQIMPIFESERSSYGQMAPLEEPQQLWGRPGWSQFSGAIRSTTNESVAAKRTVDAAAVGAEDEEGQHRKKVAKRTLAFVDLRTPDPAERQAYGQVERGDLSDSDEPLIDRLRAASATTSKVRANTAALRPRSEDPFMPSMGHPLAHDVGSSTLPIPLIAPYSGVYQAQETTEQSYPRVSIPRLLNEDQADQPYAQSRKLDDQALLMEILRRL